MFSGTCRVLYGAWIKTQVHLTHTCLLVCIFIHADQQPLEGNLPAPFITITIRSRLLDQHSLPLTDWRFNFAAR